MEPWVGAVCHRFVSLKRPIAWDSCCTASTASARLISYRDVSAKYPATEVGRGAARPARAAAVRVISDVPDPAFAMRACVQVGDKLCLADPTPLVEER